MIIRTAIGVLIVLHQLTPTLQDLTTGVDLVTHRSNKLYTKLLSDISSKLPDDNVVINGFGITTSLGLLMESTGGKTRREVQRTLNLTNADISDARLGFQAYCQLFMAHSSEAEAAGTFTTISIKTPQAITQPYKNTITKYYCVSDNVETSAPGHAVTISSDSGLMSHWKDFDKIVVYTFLSHKPVVPFYNGDLSVVHVPMIPLVGAFKNYFIEEYKSTVVLLPLQSKFAELLLLIPHGREEMKRVTKNIKKLDLTRFINRMEVSEVEVFIPQFHAVTKDFDLTPYIKKLGVNLAFDSTKANFSRASGEDNQFYLSGIKQDSYVTMSFNSIHSVAGLSTNYAANKRRHKRDAKQISADRPFLFFVIHKDTHLVLLGGKIEKPSQIPGKSERK